MSPAAVPRPTRPANDEAVRYEDVRTGAAHDAADAIIEADSALIRVTPSAMCSTDLCMYDGGALPAPVADRWNSEIGHGEKAGR